MFIPKLPDILKEKKSFSGSIRLWDVGWYIRDYSIGSYNLSPSYQRPDVWSIEQRCALIRSIFFKLPIPPVVLNVLPDEIAFGQDKKGFRFNVIDGKQRLTTLQMFVRDELEVDGLKWSQLEKGAKWRFENHSFSAIETRFETEKEESEYYELFNNSGTNH